MAMESDAPNGTCKVPGCGMIMMNAKLPGSNVTGKICPRHGSKAEEPSGKINTVKVTETDFKVVKNSKGFDESVPIAKPEGGKVGAIAPDESEKGQGLLDRAADTEETIRVIDLDVDHFGYLDNGTLVKVGLTRLQAQKIYDGLTLLEPPKSMHEMRKLVKLMDTLEEIINGSN